MRFRSLIPHSRTTPERVTGFRNEFDRLFDDFFAGFDGPVLRQQEAFLSPVIDVAETENGLEVAAELPGVDKKDIDVDLTDGVLTIKAERHQETDKEDKQRKYRLTERAYGTFMRQFALPFEVDDGRVDAKFQDGVLKIHIPRAPEAEQKSRRIAIGG